MDSHMPAVRRSASLASLRSEAYRPVRNTVPSARSLTGARMAMFLYVRGSEDTLAAHSADWQDPKAS